MIKKVVASTEAIKRAKVSQADVPNTTLEHAIRIAQCLSDNFAGKSAAPHNIALALNLSPTSGSWRNLCGSSIAYGLTEGGYNAAHIVLTDIGRRIVSPTEEGEDISAKIAAMMRPRLLKEFFQKYNKAKFPKDEIGRNVLTSMGVPKERSTQLFSLLKENGHYTGVIRTSKTGPFVAVDDPMPIDAHNLSVVSEIEDHATQNDLLPVNNGVQGQRLDEPRQSLPKQLFVAHGKNHKPLEDLKKILNEFKIPYKVAIDEPNKGRPISGKVAELMNACSAGIFIFTKDEKFFRETEGGSVEVWRPSENVVYELGAANILWDKKIIIVREEGVNFPSDLSDLGYITFKDGEIASKALEIFKELIALQLVRVSAA